MDSAPARRWLVRGSDSGFATWSMASVVAADFLVHFDVADHSLGELCARLESAPSAAYAQQLFAFARAMRVDDEVVTKAMGRWWSGTITGNYCFAPDLVPGHPHVRTVAWARSPLDGRSSIEVAQAARRQPRNTVQLLGRAPGERSSWYPSPALLDFAAYLPARRELSRME